MNHEITRLVSDADYRRTTFENSDRILTMLRDHEYYDALKHYRQMRNRVENELRLYGIDVEK